MENKIENLNILLSAFESRNEVLHDEIMKNEAAIEKLQKEIEQIRESDVSELHDDNYLKMVA